MKTVFNTENLKPIELGRLEKQLNKKYRYSEGIMTQKEYILKYAIDKKIYKGGVFNRTHYNRLDNEGQIKYEANLKAKIDYDIVLKDGCSLSIPKIIYDCLEFIEECSECKKAMTDMESNYGTDEISVCIHCYNDAQLIH
jgi:hypothetical protein